MTSQDGLATVHDLSSLGVSRAQVRTRLRTGEWETVFRGVVSLAGVEPSWRRTCRLALLVAPPAAVLGACSAARLHGFDGYDRDERIVLTYPDPIRPSILPAGVVGVRSAALSSKQCTQVDGLRCVIRPVALLQIAADDGADAAARALDSMLRRGDSPTWVRQISSLWRRKGVAGPATVMRLLDERVDRPLPRSWFQRLAGRALRERGITLADEHEVRDVNGRLLAELDLADPALKIGVECQSWRWHATPTARAHDARRKRRLRALGWEIVEVWWSDLDDIDGVMIELRLLIDKRWPLLDGLVVV
jgi:hypothetical protein